MAVNIYATDEIDRFVREIQDTHVFSVEWKDLLSSGPRSISAVGECFLAASAEKPQFSLVGAPESSSGLV